MLVDLKPRRVKGDHGAVQIDWSHPLSRRLQYACLAQSQVLTDLVGRSPVLAEKAGAVVGGSRIGPALVCDATSKGAEVATPPVLQFAAWPVSLACRFVVLGTPGANAAYVGVVHNNTNTAPFVSYSMFRSSVPRISLGWNDGTNFQNIDASRDVVVGETLSLVGVVQGGNVERIYLNGILDTTGATTTGTGPAFSSTSLVTLGNSTGITRLSNIAIDYLYIWNRVVTAGEALWLSAEPYAFLRPIPALRHFSMAPAAAAGVTVPERSKLGVGTKLYRPTLKEFLSLGLLGRVLRNPRTTRRKFLTGGL